MGRSREGAKRAETLSLQVNDIHNAVTHTPLYNVCILLDIGVERHCQVRKCGYTTIHH
jgi:hypothetical protein